MLRIAARFRSIPRLCLLLLQCAVLPTCVLDGHAQSARAQGPIDSPTATAAYILNFIRFTEWPSRPGEDPASPYLIGVSGNRALLDSLITLVDGQRVNGHPLHVVRLRSIPDIAACHVAYLEPVGSAPDYEGLRIAEALRYASGRPILTLSPAPGFLEQGGMVELFREGPLLRFSIAVESVKSTGLTMNSRLLALSRTAPVAP